MKLKNNINGDVQTGQKFTIMMPV